MTPSRGALILVAALSALAASACFPPVDASALAFIAWAPWLGALALAPRARDAAIAGAVHSVLLHVPQCAWMVVVMRTHGDVPWPMAIGMYAIGALSVAPYGIAVAVGTAVVARRHGVLALLAAPGLSALVDVARARLALGHPWLIPGMTQATHPVIMGPADVVGVHGLGAVILLANAGVAALVLVALRRTDRRRGVVVAGIAGLVLAASLGHGFAGARRHAAPWATARVVERGAAAPDASAWPAEGVRTAIVQGAQPQQVKLRSTPEDDRELASVQLELTQLALDSGAGLVVWSESAHPDTTLDLPELIPTVQRQLAKAGDRLGSPEVVVGALVVTPQPGAPRRAWPVTNSALLVDATTTLGRYDKRRLVPFGEYLPWRPVFGWFPRLANLLGDMQPGVTDEALRGAHGALGALICYEIVLPQRAWAVAATGADVLVNLTNDGWYHGTWMPEQHLRFASMRAVETRRFVLRAANSGISAVVAPDGRIVGRLEEGRQGLLLATWVPEASRTWCVRWGDGPVTLLGLASLIWAAAEAARARPRPAIASTHDEVPPAGA